MAYSTEQIVYWTKISIILGVVGSLFIIWTLFETRRAVEVSSSALTVENRPWIRIELIKFGDVFIRNGSIRVSAKFRFTNIGKSPAQAVHRATTDVDFFGEDPRVEIKNWVDGIRATFEPSDADLTIFPSEMEATEIDFIMPEASVARDMNLSSGSEASPVFAIGVFYMSDFSDEVYCTSMGYCIGLDRDGIQSSIPTDIDRIASNDILAREYPGTRRAV